MVNYDQREPPYGRYPDSWVNGLPGLGRNAMRVLLKFWQRLEFDPHGNAAASYPRAKMADELELSEAQITEATRQLKEKGLLSVKYPGHNGQATTYNVCPGKPWPARRRFGHGGRRTAA